MRPAIYCTGGIRPCGATLENPYDQNEQIVYDKWNRREGNVYSVDHQRAAETNDRLIAAAPDLLLNLQEMHVLHYGNAAELADQRERWNGLSTYEIAATLDHDTRAAIAKAQS